MMCHLDLYLSHQHSSKEPARRRYSQILIIQESAAKQGVLFASHNVEQDIEITFSLWKGRPGMMKC